MHLKKTNMCPITQSNTIFEMIVSDIKAATKNFDFCWFWRPLWTSAVLLPPPHSRYLDLAGTCFYFEIKLKKRTLLAFSFIKQLLAGNMT